MKAFSIIPYPFTDDSEVHVSTLLPGCALSALLFGFQGAALSADINVSIPGPLDPQGAIGCSLFAEEKGFPMDNSRARVQWVASSPSGVQCSFSGLPDGAYAISVAHDLNGNQRVDANFVGIPVEGWGVSGNVRPSLRAPRFDEAVFRIQNGQSLSLQIRVAK